MALYERDQILSRMLSEIPHDLDKREGSVIYNTLAPTATVLAESYYLFAHMHNLMYADTAEGLWLDRVCSDFGIDREQASYAVRQIRTFDPEGQPMDVALGSRFAVEKLIFTLTEQLAKGSYKAACQQEGTQGNLYSGAVLPVDHINNLGSALLAAAPLIPARDAESDESLRVRFNTSIRQVAFGGNIADYTQKTLAVEGVGDVKVFGAVEMGAGRVGIVLADEEDRSATPTLVEKVQGMMGQAGDGIAPIGHTVLVKTSSDLPLDVAVALRLKTGASFAIVEPFVTKAVEEYIKGISFNEPTVFYAKLVATILNSHEAIVDVGDVTVNGAAGNIPLEKSFEGYQVPVVGNITVSEVV